MEDEARKVAVMEDEAMKAAGSWNGGPKGLAGVCVYVRGSRRARYTFYEFDALSMMDR